MRYNRIVIGVDFTESSLAAARWAALEFAPDAEVVLVHALPDFAAPSYLKPYLPHPAETTAALAPVIDGALRGLASMLGAARTDVRLAVGRPADALAEAAESLGADLLCIGRGARRRGSARFGATTAVRLLSCSRVATVVVPTGAHEAPTRILTALDERADAEDLVTMASRLADAHEARLDVLHVLDDDLQALAASAHDVRLTPGAEDRTGGHLIDMSSRLDERGFDRPRLRALASEWVQGMMQHTGADARHAAQVIRLGDVGPQIVAYAGLHDVDLIVIGRGDDARHAGGVPGALHVGSTTRLVTWATPCPVLVLPSTDRRTRVRHVVSGEAGHAGRAHDHATGSWSPTRAGLAAARSDPWPRGPAGGRPG